MFSTSKIWLRKNNMVRADEDSLTVFFHKRFLSYIFKCKWNRKIGQFLANISNFLQINNKKHLLQCKVKYNDETLKI